ncbi:gynecophoral canal protein [Schistosoma japonicum]|nr:gynecophoral canal protein [Schistosoma japonicum]
MTSSNLLYTLLFSYSIICIVNYHLSSITVFGQSIKFGKISDKVSYANPDQAGEFDYKCCAGYEKIGKLSYTFRDFKKDECALQVSPYELCMESIRNHSDVYPFAEKMKTLNEFNTKNPDKPYTIFAPSTRNAEKYKDFTNSAEHIVPGRFYLKDLKSGLQLNTLDPKRKLYVTRELHGWMLTWNVTRASYIQLDISSILSLLESNSETQSFAKDLSAALKNNLKNINSGHRYTVIVPSQKSWELLRQKYSSEQLQRIAANHVILNQHCSGHLIQSLENYKSLLGEKLEFICETDSTGKERHYVRTMFNDKHELTITDLTSSNGVAHIIEEPLIPFSGWSTYSPFQDEYKRFQADKEYRCRVARYHVVKSDNRLNNIGNFASHTLGHRTINPNEALYETTYFKKTPYGSQLNFHYSPVNNLESYELDDVTIYVTPRINVPPEVNMTDIINNRADTT